MTEHIIFVDENDQPIGTGPREEAWAKGIYVRFVRIILRDEKGRILAQRRSSTKKSYPNKWVDSACGHVDEGETYEFAASRELQEELGVSVDLRLLDRFPRQDNTDGKKVRQFSSIYEGVVYSSTQFMLEKDEVAEVKWYEVNDLKSLMQQTPDIFTPGFRETIDRFY